MTNDTIRKNLKRDIQGMKTAFFIKLLACVCGASLLLISGCANAPLDELDNAKTIDEMNAFAARVGITPTVAEWHGLAEQGDATAQVQLGWMYNNGEGVVKDDKQAAAWYRKAAEQGQVFAQFNLGMMYFNGQGVPKDYSQAVAWSRLAAEQGHVQAQYFLGWMYTNGLGVVQDDWQALSWIRKAAEQGHVKAQVSLSAMYAQGRGTAPDVKLAYIWSSVAAVNGDADAAHNRDLLAQDLSYAELSDAQAMAGQYAEAYRPQQ